MTKLSLLPAAVGLLVVHRAEERALACPHLRASALDVGRNVRSASGQQREPESRV